MRAYGWIQVLLITIAIWSLCEVYLLLGLGRDDRQRFVNGAWIVFGCSMGGTIVLRQITMRFTHKQSDAAE
jgi:hypothetical protein